MFQPAHDHAAMMQAAQEGTQPSQSGGFLSGLFEVFTPRQQCMNYEPDVVWMHILADATIAAAYFSIPLALIYFVRRRKDLAFNWMFVLFAAFILACGTTHVFGVIAIWRPYYRLDGIVKVVTGLVSIATAVLLWPLVTKALLLPSPAQLRVANDDLQAQIVERKKAEAEARRSSEELERRVHERTAELHAVSEERADLLVSERAARTEAERASRIKDDFVATLSHELRTPLSAIMGWTHLLRIKPDRPDAGYGLEVIERNTRAQARMIDDLLDMSRIVSGKLRLDVQSVDVSDVFEAALQTVRPAADARHIALTHQAEHGVGEVKGDAARLQQIVWNLLTNAIKFTPQGGKVHVALTRSGAHVEISVEDTGQGIKPEFLPFVFERFRQQDSSTTRAHGGLGIGLSIVRHLVEMHGGTVSASSPGEGAGTTFRVSLPVIVGASRTNLDEGSRHAVPASGPRPNESPSLSGIRVLVVDDEADARELVKRVLEEAGATVVTAGSAAEGLEAFAAQTPELIISDIGMPVQDGYEFIRLIRQLPQSLAADHPVPAIALTAFARREDRTRSLIAGYQAHIAKPADPTELLATAASLTGRVGR